MSVNPEDNNSGRYGFTYPRVADPESADAASKVRLNEIVEAAHANGKEPFDFDVFSTHFRIDDIQSIDLQSLSDEAKNTYRIRYYVDYPAITNILSFAQQCTLEDRAAQGA